MHGATVVRTTHLTQQAHWTDRVAHMALAVVALAMVAFLAVPLLAILQQALEGKEGEFVGSELVEAGRAALPGGEGGAEPGVGRGAEGRQRDGQARGQPETSTNEARQSHAGWDRR